MSSVLALIVSFAAGFGLLSPTSGDAEATTQLPDLCISTGILLPGEDGRGACEFSDATAPVLAAEVCWNGATARIKGSSACLGNERVYFAKYGEVVDPQTGVIQGYAPLTDACNVVACTEVEIQPGPLGDGVACCDEETGDCWPAGPNGICSVGDVTWCKDITPNNDGTVTCHE